MLDEKAKASGRDRKIRTSLARHYVVSAVICLALVGGIGVWAATQKISGAVVAPGRVVVESNVKTVKHREGGIVRAIHVKPGDLVDVGQPLVELDDTISRTNLAVVANQIFELGVQEKRLIAERDEHRTLNLPVNVDENPKYADIRRGEVLLFEARRASILGRKRQLTEQITQFEKQIEGLEAQLEAKVEEIGLVSAEFEDLSALLEKNLVSRSRITAIKRERVRLKGEHGVLISQIAQAREAISERKIQILQIDESYRAEVLEQLKDTRSKLAQLEERRIAAEDELSRSVILAPQSGFVHQLAVHTEGGVIAPGEALMLIVPREDQLIIEVQVRPVDIDQLGPDQVARVRLPSFDQRTTPELNAKILTVSADATRDEHSGESTYTTRILIDEEELSRLDGKRLLPGMPAEAFLTTQERTILSYLVKPVSDQIAHAMRER